MRRLLAPLLLVGAVLGLWQAWVRWAHVPAYVLPAPSEVFAALYDQRAPLASHAATTLTESLVGLGTGLFVGVGVAVVIALSPWLMRGVQPLLVASQTVPVVVLAPLLVMWFGFGLAPKVVIVGLMTFFPVAVAMVAAMNSTNVSQVELLTSMGAGRIATMRYLRFPAAIPAGLSGLRIAAAYAVGGAVVGEYVGSERGLGVFIDRARSAFRVDRVFAAVIVVAALSALLFAVVELLDAMVAPWHRRGRRPLARWAIARSNTPAVPLPADASERNHQTDPATRPR